jgi:hypothetical protein
LPLLNESFIIGALKERNSEMGKKCSVVRGCSSGKPCKKESSENTGDAMHIVELMFGPVFSKSSKSSKSSKAFIPVEIQINDMYKRVCNYLYNRLQDPLTPITGDEIVELMMVFGGPSIMRRALRSQEIAKLLLGDKYSDVTKMTKNNDPFAIVIKRGNRIWTVACPYEDEH